MRIALIMNTSGADAGDQLHAQVARLRHEGKEVIPRLTFEQGDGRRFAREAVAAGAELVIAAGGDGTVNEVANGVADALRDAAAGTASAPPLTRLAIIPLGTANDLASALEVPQEIGAAFDVALGGIPTEVDVATLNGRCFLNVSTGGFGAEATEEAAQEVKRTLGPLAYVITGVKKFVELHPSTGRFVSDEVLHEGPFLLFAVGNSGRTGGGNWLTPRASLTDGLLDVCIVKEMSRVEFASLMPQLRSGDHLDHPGVVYRQVRSLRIESSETLSVNVDGEPIRSRELEYGISPRRLLLMFPRGRIPDRP